MVVMAWKGYEGVIQGKGGQKYSDRRFDFGWRAHNTIYRWCIIDMYTWKLYNFINQCHPVNLIFKKENNSLASREITNNILLY